MAHEPYHNTKTITKPYFKLHNRKWQKNQTLYIVYKIN